MKERYVTQDLRGERKDPARVPQGCKATQYNEPIGCDLIHF